MDQSVLDSIARWPNVPAVEGWLSLTRRGQWRLHPKGDALLGGAGVSVSNTQILGFLDRNYSSESDGRYFFQNGPQRVYVRLDAAPYVLHLRPEDGSLRTHNQRAVRDILRWLIDDRGNVFAQTDIGPACVDDRDLFLLTELLVDAQGQHLLAHFNPNEAALLSSKLEARSHDSRFSSFAEFAPVVSVPHQQVATLMKFITHPTVPVKSTSKIS